MTMIEIPAAIPELAKAMTPTWILITVLFILPVVIGQMLILALAFRNSKSKRLGAMYLIVVLMDILQVLFIVGLWVFRELIIKISFV